MTIQESPTFDTAYPISPRKDGPFCSGHIWILDGNGDPKFLAVGGVDFDVTQGASRETFWFDPNAAGPQHWFDGPGPLPVLEQSPGGGDQVGSWYPTVMTFLDPVAARFRAIAIGGTSLRSAECVDDARYGGWWTLSMNGVWSAVTNSDGYEWPWYPRSHLLHTASGEGEILTAGIDNVDGCTNQEPCHKIVTHSPTQTHQVFASQPGGVGMWNTNNTVLMHTLAPGWVWAPGDALSHYLLNRVIGTMGTSGPGAAPVLAETRELVNGSWVEKADASTARYFSNAVLLPDGSVLVVGGQSNKAKGGNTTTVYWSAADRFVPGQPSTLGSWTTLATTSFVGGDPPYSTPRGYHSVALLLPDGSVLLMGGQRHSDPVPFAASDPDDSVDHFQPPYFFQGNRPILGNPPQTIHYGETFEVNLTVSLGRTVKTFCLMGIGSVTHHEDFGQRYVELMWRTPPPSGSPPYQASKLREVLAPPAR